MKQILYVTHLQCFDSIGWVACKNRVSVFWRSYVQMTCKSVTTATSIISWCSKSQDGLTFWYWLTQAVQEYWPLNKCNSSSSTGHCIPAMFWYCNPGPNSCGTPSMLLFGAIFQSFSAIQLSPEWLVAKLHSNIYFYFMFIIRHLPSVLLG